MYKFVTFVIKFVQVNKSINFNVGNKLVEIRCL